MVEIMSENDINMKDNHNDEDDIYGDLESEIFTSAYKPQKKEEPDENLQEILKEHDTLKAEIKRLTKENKAYATNISSLYLTAKSEIEKKNFIIKQLQTKLQDFATNNARKSNISKNELIEILKECQETYSLVNSQFITKEIAKIIKDIKSSKTATGSKKQYKFGNMSLFFCREQVPFKRSAKVEFPEKIPTTKINETENNLQKNNSNSKDTSKNSTTTRRKSERVRSPVKRNRL